MKIVIEISEEDYKLIKSYGKGSTNYRISLNLYDAVRDGTPLPEHHGRLIDADALYDSAPLCHTEEDGTACVEWREIKDAPTIIEGSDSE